MNQLNSLFSCSMSHGSEPRGERHPTRLRDDVHSILPHVCHTSCNVDCHAKKRAGRRSDRAMYFYPLYLTPHAWRLALFRQPFDATCVFQLVVQDAHPPAQTEGRSEKGHASRSRWCLHTTTFFFLQLRRTPTLYISEKFILWRSIKPRKFRSPRNLIRHPIPEVFFSCRCENHYTILDAYFTNHRKIY